MHSVEPWGPAQRAGVRRGQVIVEINGVDIRGASHKDAVALLQAPASESDTPQSVKLSVCNASSFIRHVRDTDKRSTRETPCKTKTEKKTLEEKDRSVVRKLYSSESAGNRHDGGVLVLLQQQYDDVLEFLQHLRCAGGLNRKGLKLLEEYGFVQILDELKANDAVVNDSDGTGSARSDIDEPNKAPLFTDMVTEALPWSCISDESNAFAPGLLSKLALDDDMRAGIGSESLSLESFMPHISAREIDAGDDMRRATVHSVQENSGRVPAVARPSTSRVRSEPRVLKKTTERTSTCPLPHRQAGNTRQKVSAASAVNRVEYPRKSGGQVVVKMKGGGRSVAKAGQAVKDHLAVERRRKSDKPRRSMSKDATFFKVVDLHAGEKWAL